VLKVYERKIPNKAVLDLWAIEREFLLFERYNLEMPTSRFNDLKGLILNKSKKTDLYIVKNRDNKVCGYGGIEFKDGAHFNLLKKIKSLDLDKFGYIGRDYSFKEFRGRGIHRFLILSRLDVLKKMGYTKCTTRVAVQNVISNHSYRKCGFNKKLLEFHFHFFGRFKKSNYLLLPCKQKNKR